MRVYELARKFNAGNDELLAVLRDAGFTLKNHMSGVTGEMVAAAEKHFKPPKTKAKSKAKKTDTKAKRKTARKAAPAKAKAKPAAKETVVSPVKPTAKAVKSQTVSKKEEPKRAPAAEKIGKKIPAAADARFTRKTAPKPPKPSARTADVQRPGQTVRPAPEAKKPKPVPKPPKRAVSDREAHREAQQKAVRESVRRTLAKLEVARRTKRRKGKAREAGAKEKAPIRIAEGPTTVQRLAEVFKLSSSEIIEKCLELGVEAKINETVDKDLVDLLAEGFGKRVVYEIESEGADLKVEVPVEPSRLKPRAPIVTVMGHVDHGKTSILDYIRRTNVAAGEAGGITQHIGAYEVETPKGSITFIDTPGHEAFTSMRARGARVTDLVVLVVAADDGVMPQTIEAINHARAADVPIVVAVNKTDLPGGKPVQVKQQLVEHKVVVEEFGGDVLAVETSAKTGQGIDKLLESILLQAEFLELKADEKASAQGVVIEVKKEEGRGILCTCLVTQGTLKVGDVFVAGVHYGKVRALLNHRGEAVQRVVPAMPVLVLGCNGLPQAGDSFMVVSDEREARDVSLRRQGVQKAKDLRTTKKLTLEELYTKIQEGSLKELRLIIKGDTNGSVEALSDSLSPLSNKDVAVRVLHSGVGVVSESDVLLGASSNALIIGFNVRTSPKAQELAGREKVEIRHYNIIYECLEEISDAMKGMLEPERVERVLGRAEVRRIFKISKLGLVAGSLVVEGTISRNAMVRVIRSGEVVHEGKIASLKRFQDDVREVQKDFECGIGVSGLSDLREGDILEAFVIEEKAHVG